MLSWRKISRGLVLTSFLLLVGSLLPVSGTLLRITDTGSPPGLQYNMLQYPVTPLNRDLENFGIGLPHPYPDEMALPCAFYPPCPQAITFDYPQCQSAGASHVNMYIDGVRLVNNTGTASNRLRYYTVPGYPLLISGTPGPDTIWTKWYINSPTYPYQIELNEWNWIDFVDRNGAPYPAVYFKFKVINLDALPHAVGVMLNLDLKLGNRLWCTDCSGGNDNPDLQIGGLGTIQRNTRAFGLSATPPSSVPGFFQGYELGPTYPDNSQVVIYGDMRGPGLTAPDFFGVGNDTIRSYSWFSDWSRSDTTRITDANSMVGWGPLTLEPNDEVTWITRIGLGPATVPDEPGLIQVNPINLPSMWFDRCTTQPSVLQFNYQLLNTHLTSTAHGVGARLEFMARVGCFSFVSPQTVMLNPDSLIAYTFSPAAWDVMFDNTDCAMPSGDSARVPLRVITQSTTAGFRPDTSFDTITVRWHTPSHPVVTNLWTPTTPRTTCEPACVSWLIEHTDTIVTDSIYLFVNNNRQAFGPAQWINAPGRFDTLRICIPRPVDDTAKVELRRFFDVYGCTEEPAMVHTIRLQWDRDPPVVTSCTPAPGTSTPSRMTQIQIGLIDSVYRDTVSLATLDSTCIQFTLQTPTRPLRTIPLSDPQLSWNPATGMLTFVPSPNWAYADTINYCLIDACDLAAPPSCGNNRLARDTCVQFFVTPAFPDVELLVPDTSGYTISCRDAGVCVTWLVQNFYGINRSTIQVSVNGGTSFGEGTNGLVFIDVPGSPYDTLRLCPASGPIWREGANDVVIRHICDVLSACIDNVGAVSFVRDTTGPVASALTPANGTCQTDMTPDIRFDITDNGSGLDSSSIHVTAGSAPGTIPGWSRSFHYPAEIQVAGGQFYIAPTHLPSLTSGDRIYVCVDSAFDMRRDSTVRPYWPDSVNCPRNSLQRVICDTFRLDNMGPVATLVTPRDGIALSCDSVCVVIAVTDDGALGPPPELRIGGTRVTPTILHPTPDSMLITYCYPTRPIDGTQTITLNIEDSCANRSNFNWFFIYDGSPPDPWESSDCIDSAMVNTSFSVRLYDAFTNVVPESVRFWIDDSLFTLFDGTGMLIQTGGPNPLNLTWNPDHNFVDTSGSTHTVCLNFSDQIDSCGDNWTNYPDSCCTFTINQVGTTLTSVDGLITHCTAGTDSYGVAINIISAIGIIESTLVVTVQTDTGAIDTYIMHPTPSRWIHFRNDTLIELQIPPTHFPDPLREVSNVRFCVTHLVDSTGIDLGRPYCWNVIADNRPPDFSNWSMPSGLITPDIAPMCSVTVYDSLSGVDTTCFRFYWGHDVATHSSSIGDPGITSFRIDDHTVRVVVNFGFLIPGPEWSGGDSVVYYACACDSSFDACAPDTACAPFRDFHISAGGSFASLIYPAAADTSLRVISCVAETVRIRIDSPNPLDTNQIFGHTTVGFTTYVWTAESTWVRVLHYSGDRDTVILEVIPPGPFVSGQSVTTCLDSAWNSLRNPLANPFCFTWQIDNTPPSITTITPYPPPTRMRRSDLGTVSCRIDDAPAGVNPSSITLTLNTFRGTTVITAGGTFTGGFWSADLAALGVRDTLPEGADLHLCLRASDLATRCGVNARADTCWTLYIGGPGPTITPLNPPTGRVWSCDTVCWTWRVEDTDGVSAASIMLRQWVSGPPGADFAAPPGAYNPGTSILTYCLPLHDGDSVGVMVTQAVNTRQDTTILAATDTARIVRMTDKTAPVAGAHYPATQETVAVLCPDIWFVAHDARTGINTSRISVSIPDRGFTANWPHPSLSLAADTLRFDVHLTGADTCWAICDQPIVCADFYDQPDTCGANHLHVCDTFNIQCTGIRVAQPTPLPDSVRFCRNFPVTWQVTIDPTTTINDNSVVIEVATSPTVWTLYPFTDGFTTVNRVNDSVWAVTFTPPDTILYNCDWARLRVSHLADMLGAFVDNRAPVVYNIDCAPPHAACTNDTDYTSINTPSLFMDLVDSASYVALNSVQVEVYGPGPGHAPLGPFAWGSPVLAATPLGANGWHIEIRTDSIVPPPYYAAGDTVRYCLLSVTDSTDRDTCAGHTYIPAPSFCCELYITFGAGPSASVTGPTAPNICYPPGDPNFAVPIHITVAAPDNVNPSTMGIAVSNGPVTDTVRYGQPGVSTFDTLTGIVIVYPGLVAPALTWGDGSVITVTLFEVWDSHGDPLGAQASRSWTVDMVCPTASNPRHVPPGPVVAATTASLLVDVADRNGIEPDSLVMIVRVNSGTWDTFQVGPRATFAGGTMTIPSTSLGPWVGNDVIHYCLIAAADTFDICPNLCTWTDTSSITCDSFTIAGDVMTRWAIWPPESVISACAVESVVVGFATLHGLDTAAVTLTINATSYGTPLVVHSPELQVRPGPTNTFYYQIPAGSAFQNRDHVCATMSGLCDELGVCAADTTWCWDVDIAPPVAWGNFPPNDTSMRLDTTWQIPIGFQVADSFAGLDTSTVRMHLTVIGPLCAEPSHVWLDQVLTPISVGVTWDSLHFTYDPAVPGVRFPEFATVCATVSGVRDLATVCPANVQVDSLHWCFTVLDDDTLKPEFSNTMPHRVRADRSYRLHVTVSDSSGINEGSSVNACNGSGVIAIVYRDFSLAVADTFPMSFPGDSVDTIAPLGKAPMDLITMTFTTGDIPAGPEGTCVPYHFAAADADTDFSNCLDPLCNVSALDTICFTDITGPLLWVTFPPNGIITSCPDTIATALVTDTAAIDPSSVRVIVTSGGPATTYPLDGIIVSMDSVGLDSSRITYRPQPAWINGDVVTVVFDGVADVHGNVGNADTVSYTVDMEPPAASCFGLLDSVNMVSDTIYRPEDLLRAAYVWNLSDNIAGVEDSSIRVIFWVTNTGVSRTFAVGDTAVDWNNGEFAIHPSRVPLAFGFTDTICISVTRLWDRAELCGPNVQTAFDTCCFYAEPFTICDATPVPFTPNNDGKNDYVEFDFPFKYQNAGTVMIYDLRGVLVVTLVQAADRTIKWYGLDLNGQPAPPGLYLYATEVDGKVVCNGTISIAR